MGPAGAWFSDIAFLLFGASAYLFPILVLIAGVFLFRRDEMPQRAAIVWRGAGFLLAIATTSGLATLHFQSPVLRETAGKAQVARRLHVGHVGLQRIGELHEAVEALLFEAGSPVPVQVRNRLRPREAVPACTLELVGTAVSVVGNASGNARLDLTENRDFTLAASTRRV